jgi:endoglucanase
VRFVCEPPDRGPDTINGADSDVDEGRIVDPKDQTMGGEEMGDMDASVSGEMAGETAGAVAGETAGAVAGEVAGEIAGEGAGESAGAVAGENAGDMAGEVMIDLGVAGEDVVDMGRPISLTPWLYTSGPNVYQTGARPWVGRGVNLHDTRSCDTCTWIQPNVDEVLRRVDEVIDNWGATLVRINLESYALASGRIQYRPLGEDRAYLTDLERIVHHIGQKRGVYIIISLWRDPSLSDEGYPTDQTLEILRLLVRSFYDAPQVIFSVSPGVRQNDQGALNQNAWEAMNTAVNAIRDEERTLSPYRHLITVPGLRNLGSDLSYYIEHPITAGNGDNILYETHIFQSQSNFDALLVSPAQSLPVIIGSFGPSETPPRMMTQTDAVALIQEAERLSVSWAAWTFHMRCVTSAMLVDETNNGCGVEMALRPTEWGMAIQAQLGLY